MKTNEMFGSLLKADKVNASKVWLYLNTKNQEEMQIQNHREPNSVWTNHYMQFVQHQFDSPKSVMPEISVAFLESKRRKPKNTYLGKEWEGALYKMILHAKFLYKEASNTTKDLVRTHLINHWKINRKQKN